MKIDTHRCLWAREGLTFGSLVLKCHCGEIFSSVARQNEDAVNAFTAHLARAFREALLSPEVVTATAVAILNEDSPTRVDEDDEAIARQGITAAADHVFGPPKADESG